MTKQSTSEQLGQAVVSYGKIVLTIIIGLLTFCVWAVPNYLISQREAVAEQRYCTKQEASAISGAEAKEVENRINQRITAMESKLDKIYDWVIKQ